MYQRILVPTDARGGRIEGRVLQLDGVAPVPAECGLDGGGDLELFKDIGW